MSNTPDVPSFDQFWKLRSPSMQICTWKGSSIFKSTDNLTVLRLLKSLTSANKSGLVVLLKPERIWSGERNQTSVIVSEFAQAQGRNCPTIWNPEMPLLFSFVSFVVDQPCSLRSFLSPFAFRLVEKLKQLPPGYGIHCWKQ